MKKIKGIYQIINIKTKKVYVGSAVDIKNRFKTHKRLLKNNKHFNNHLQSSYNKYGLENFKYEIIEVVNDDIDLIERENQIIKELDSNNPIKGYNKRIQAGSNLGIKLSDITKKRLSESHMGHKRSEEANQLIIESQYRSVCQFNSEGEYVQTFESLQDASKSMNIKYTTGITSCLKKRIKSVHGYYWCYENEKDTFKPKGKIKCDSPFEVYDKIKNETIVIRSVLQLSKLINKSYTYVKNRKDKIIETDKFICKKIIKTNLTSI